MKRSVPYIAFAASTSADAISPASPSLALQVALAIGPSAEVAFRLDNVAGATQQFAMRVDGSAASFTLDAGVDLLPWLGPSTFDPATAALHSAGSVGRAPTIIQSRMSWQ